jgi:hypothetical protein
MKEDGVLLGIKENGGEGTKFARVLNSFGLSGVLRDVEAFHSLDVDVFCGGNNDRWRALLAKPDEGITQRRGIARLMEDIDEGEGQPGRMGWPFHLLLVTQCRRVSSGGEA